jgi:two-component sensor histidine kinase
LEAIPHPRQQERLAALRGYGILDTEPDSDFDDIVQLASQLCETPISVVNLIDEDRQWFKAETGLGLRETPIATSLCAHAILEDDLVEIRDTLLDTRMADNPLVAAKAGLRFYAGVLLVAENGLPLGTLCVLDYKPRELTDLQRNALRVLGRQVMTQMELRRALKTADLLRSEVDHRVKNSLQLLASLTSLQSRAAPDAATRAALDVVRGRIAGIADLHDLLYKTDAVGVIAIDAYLARVVETLRTGLPKHITLQAQLAPAKVTSRMAASLGLILNELVTNSVKHGFTDASPDAAISLSLEVAFDGGLLLGYQDNGKGMAPDVASSGLGLRVIESLVDQMSGAMMRVPSELGYSLRLTFPPSKT